MLYSIVVPKFCFRLCFEWLWCSQDLMQYMDHMDSLSHRLIGLLCEGIAVDSSQKFKALHDNTTGNFIAAHYPPCPRPELAHGLRAHTDPHSLSILYQEYPGLQLLKDGKWLAVKPEVGTFIVNVGDMLQVLLGLLNSPRIRVLSLHVFFSLGFRGCGRRGSPWF